MIKYPQIRGLNNRTLKNMDNRWRCRSIVLSCYQPFRDMILHSDYCAIWVSESPKREKQKHLIDFNNFLMGSEDKNRIFVFCTKSRLIFLFLVWKTIRVAHLYFRIRFVYRCCTLCPVVLFVRAPKTRRPQHTSSRIFLPR